MTQIELLDRLELNLTNLLKQVRANFINQPPETLFLRSIPGKWNAQECFAHLNAQFDYYIPRIEMALHKAKARKWTPVEERESNWMGQRSIRSVDPAHMHKRQRRSPKAINPSKLLQVRDNEVKVFLINTELLLRMVRQAREVNINKPTIKPMQWSLSSFVLGDLLEFLVLHAQRHLLQAQASLG